MSRWKAAFIHFILSLIMGALVFCVVYFIWYPTPLFKGFGGRNLLTLIISVDVVLGPLLTLIVFKTGKKSLKFDLTVIALLQLAALVYGLHTTAVARPAFLAFAKDRIVAVPANALEAEDLKIAASNPSAKISWLGPKLVAAIIPTDSKLREKVMETSFGGKDIQAYPQYYEPYEKHVLEVIKQSKPISELEIRSSAQAAKIESIANKYKLQKFDLGYLPFELRKNRYYTAIINRRDGAYLATIEANPW